MKGDLYSFLKLFILLPMITIGSIICFVAFMMLFMDDEYGESLFGPGLIGLIFFGLPTWFFVWLWNQVPKWRGKEPHTEWHNTPSKNSNSLVLGEIQDDMSPEMKAFMGSYKDWKDHGSVIPENSEEIHNEIISSLKTKNNKAPKKKESKEANLTGLQDAFAVHSKSTKDSPAPKKKGNKKTSDKKAELKEAKELFDEDLINEEEYANMRKEILK